MHRICSSWPESVAEESVAGHCGACGELKMPQVAATLMGSALHARDAKKFVRAHTEKLKLGREAEIKVKKFNDNIAIRHSDSNPNDFGGCRL